MSRRMNEIKTIEDLLPYVQRTLGRLLNGCSDDEIDNDELFIFDRQIGISVDKDGMWHAVYYESIPGQFNPKDGGNPPETVEHPIISDTDPLKVGGQAIMYYAEKVVKSSEEVL